MMQNILQYYDELAENYDQNRFGNSYGTYIDEQEKAILKEILEQEKWNYILDIGCGTGRLLNFATHGIDFSPNMLEKAAQKHPDKVLKNGELNHIPFSNETFDCIFCFHVIMHQKKEMLSYFLNETYNKLKPNGILIFDIISKNRRTKFSEQNSWHANNSYEIIEIKNTIEKKWKLKEIRGIMLFPIHRLSNNFRKLLLPVDIFLCKTFLKKWASYQVIVLEKK